MKIDMLKRLLWRNNGQGIQQQVIQADLDSRPFIDMIQAGTL